MIGIEVVMRFYKQAFEFDGSRVHDDYSGAEGKFIRFLSNVLIYKSINGAEKKRVLKNVLMDN